MNAGRELDALVAEKVMGWVWTVWTPEIQKDDADPPYRKRWLTAPGFIESFATSGWKVPPMMLATGDEEIGDPGDESPPAYSTDISAAWDVFQVIMGRLFSVRNRFFWALQDQAHLGGDGDTHTASGLWALQVLKDRFPLAICLAALHAVQAEVPA